MKNINFPFLTNFTGRNGYGKCSGLEILQDIDREGGRCIMLTPLTSKGSPANCDILIPVASIDNLVAQLLQIKNGAIGQEWMVSSMSSDDVFQTSVVPERDMLTFLESEAEDDIWNGDGDRTTIAQKNEIAAACHADFLELKETEGSWYAFELQMNGTAYYFQKLPR